jgi:hypothetical protein
VSEEERKIVRFVRTPEGRGVGVVREGGGDAWIVRERGTRLGRAGRWDDGDLVVVLDGGEDSLLRKEIWVTDIFIQAKASQHTHQQTKP